MNDSLASRLATRFNDDAAALRARATVLDARTPGKDGGPDGAACRTMADACDRVSVLFAGVADDASLRATAPELDRLLKAERSPDAQHVYAGAVARLRQSLDPAADDADDEDADLDDDGEDEER